MNSSREHLIQREWEHRENPISAVLNRQGEGGGGGGGERTVTLK